MSAKRITVAEYLRNPTPEKYERMVEQGATALAMLAWRNGKREDEPCGIWITRKPDEDDIRFYSQYVRAALCTIGITKGRK